MRFAEHLSAHLTPEWRTQYVQYEELRDYLTKAVEEAPSDDEVSGELRKLYFNDCDHVFFSYCTPEINKINNFFEEKLAEARRKFVSLKNELMEYEEQVGCRTSVWQSLQMLASGSGDKKKASRRTRRKERREKMARDHLELVKMEKGDLGINENGTNKDSSSSVIGDLTRRISSTNFQHMIQRTQERRQELRREKRRVRKLHEIKLGFTEFYLSLVLLQNYQSLNFTGFRKIMKKHDKLFFRSTGERWRMIHVDNSFFHTNKEVDQIITKVETLYTSQLEQGDRSRAMKRLRVPPLAEKLNLWTTFRVGYMFGVFAVQVIIIVLALFYLRPLPEIWEPAMRLYRGSFIVAVFVLLIGVNTYGWQTAGVNHVLIFEIDPRHHLTHQEFLEISAMLLIVWASSLIYFLFSPIMGTPAYAGPLVVAVFNMLYLFNPSRCLHHKARRWLLRILRRIFLAPYYSVNFADFWLADQLNSLVIVFTDCLFLICFYFCQIDWANGLQPLAAAIQSSAPGLNHTGRDSAGDRLNATRTGGAGVYYQHLKAYGGTITVDSHGGFCSSQMYGLVVLVRCLPAWFRLAQCLRRYVDMEIRAPFPHLVNAGKYSTTFFVVGFSVLKTTLFPDSKLCLALWLIFLVVATVYTYAWDILMDWGLFDCNEVKCSARSVLRDELVYRKTASYYFAIIEDLLLRLAWVLDVTLTHYRVLDSELLKCFLAFGEAIRRFVWNFFRLENEHLNNCGQFRAVRDIFISPIASNLVTQERPKRAPKEGSSQGGSGVSEGGSSSGVGGSSTVGSCREKKSSENHHEGKMLGSDGAHSKRKSGPRVVDTPQRYQPKGGRLFSSRSSLDVLTRSLHPDTLSGPGDDCLVDHSKSPEARLLGRDADDNCNSETIPSSEPTFHLDV